MSVRTYPIRAYRVEEIKTADIESFDLWHDEELVEFLDREYGIYSQLSEDAGGLMDLPVTVLERAVAEAKLTDDQKESLLRDIAVAKASGDDYIQYYCF